MPLRTMPSASASSHAQAAVVLETAQPASRASAT